MSAPPISSPRTKTCGIVGQLEIAESSWRISGSGRTSTAVIGAPDRAERLERPLRVPAERLLRRALDEDRDGLGVDDGLDPVVQLGSCVSSGLDA